MTFTLSINENQPVVSLKSFLISCLFVLPGIAGEGLWPYNQVPTATIKQKHAFDVEPAFLDHLRLSSVKIGAGSGAFVSPTGLLLTTRQIAGDCLAAQSSTAHDYFRDGFQAASPAAELPCPGLAASVLVKIDDVTESVKAAGTTLALRNAAIAKAEKDCTAKSGNVCTVVRFFSGGRYDLYQYRRYSELHLVFAPEYAIAFFGRERDSSSYLRYGLNVAFLRAYEKGAPAATPDFLKWSADGVKDGDLVFLAGNPGPTGRLSTSAQLTFLRDTALPLSLTRLQPRLQQLNAFAAANEVNLRAAQATLSSLLTAYKSDAGKLIGLRDDRLVTRKTAFEGKIRRAVEGNAKLGAEAGKVWDEIAAAYRKWHPFEKPYQILEASAAPGCRLFHTARQIVRGEALDDSGDPVNEAIETMMLAQYLGELQALGEKEVPLKSILAGATPQAAAERIVKASLLKDAAGRTRVAANRDAALKSTDGVIALASSIDPAALRLRKQHDEIIGALEVTSQEKIAGFRLKLFGAADYPDGTSTPRLEYGVVKGYIDRAAVPQPYGSTFSGLYYRKDNDGVWQLPQRWLDARSALNPVTLLDFVSTADIGGGDYGSPAVNLRGELVGLTFDGNLESLPNTYLYSDEQARAVHVDVRGIVEALTQVYKAGALLKELAAPQPSGSDPSPVH
uniref:Dipeptidyl-peptidase n=1 Tax=Solibacter usitatus (strain Ellin6076) TaxID=234267 RepID=Q02D16_SOLUE